jgi:predicted transcriptional regulator
MSKSEIARMLKVYRNRCELSVGEVIIKLKQAGIEISAKTLYGYENGVSSPDVDTFMLLCSFYGIEDFADFDSNNNVIDIDPAARQLLEERRVLASKSSKATLEQLKQMNKIMDALFGENNDD